MTKIRWQLLAELGIKRHHNTGHHYDQRLTKVELFNSLQQSVMLSCNVQKNEYYTTFNKRKKQKWKQTASNIDTRLALLLFLSLESYPIQFITPKINVTLKIFALYVKKIPCAELLSDFSYCSDWFYLCNCGLSWIILLLCYKVSQCYI